MTTHMELHNVISTERPTSTGGCPVDHRALAQAKTAHLAGIGGAPIEQDAAGVWHVRSYDAVRAVLRSAATKQAGFRAELLDGMERKMRAPVLYQEGQEHHTQRKQTARFFTPKATSENYHQLMADLADQMVAELVRSRRADISALGMRLAVRVASEVVGLTNSRLPGMDKRLNAFFANPIGEVSWRPAALLNMWNAQTRVLRFFYLDVKPAIKARRRAPKADVISHLIESGYRDTEILTECITYAAAGMATTREFLAMATWHMLDHPALRAQYLAADEEQRHILLQEMLRAEPVIGHLWRRATADLPIELDDTSVTIPAGALIDMHIYDANTDLEAVGAEPLAICPGRELNRDRATPAVMSFGDGSHRCPGAYIAIQETDLFLQRLLAVKGLRIERPPMINWSTLTHGYELRNFIVAVD